MAGLPRALIKKYGVSKKAWAVFRGRRGKARAARSQSRGGSTAKKKSGFKRKKGFPGASYIKPVVFSTLAGTGAGLATPFIKRSVRELSGQEHLDLALGAGTGALAGYAGKKNWKGALVGLLLGATSAKIAAPPIGRAINQATNSNLY